MIPSQFELVLTADNSPSFQQLDHPNTELMHHRGGAYTETQYIYGDAIRRALHVHLKSFVSVGLGLGYNELLIAVECLKNGVGAKDVFLVSYEVVEQLKTDFLAFVHGAPTPKVYTDILSFFRKDYSSSDDEVRAWLREAYQTKRWLVQGGLSAQSEVLEPAQCCLFDAFSSKTTPELWSEDFLKIFLSQHLDQKAIFATYARTGVLKRSLLEQGFELLKKPGFFRRKDSTLALRGF